MKKTIALLAILITIAANAQDKVSESDTTGKTPVVLNADTAFVNMANNVYRSFSQTLSSRLLTTQWQSVLGEFGQTLYQVTMEDLKRLLAAAIADWNKRKQPGDKPKN